MVDLKAIRERNEARKRPCHCTASAHTDLDVFGVCAHVENDGAAADIDDLLGKIEMLEDLVKWRT